MSSVTLSINGQPIAEIKKGHPDLITDDDSEGCRSLAAHRIEMFTKSGQVLAKQGDIVEMPDGKEYVCVNAEKQEFREVVK